MKKAMNYDSSYVDKQKVLSYVEYIYGVTGIFSCFNGFFSFGFRDVGVF